MTESTLVNFITSAGPGALSTLVLFWVVWQFISGKLHSNSELEARDELIKRQDEIISGLTTRLQQLNDIFEKAVERGYTTRGRSG